MNPITVCYVLLSLCIVAFVVATVRHLANQRPATRKASGGANWMNASRMMTAPSRSNEDDYWRRRNPRWR